jgi:hypothetical protein
MSIVKRSVAAATSGTVHKICILRRDDLEVVGEFSRAGCGPRKL